MSERLASTAGEDGKFADEDITAEIMAMLYAGASETSFTLYVLMAIMNISWRRHR